MSVSDEQAATIADGFRTQAQKSNYTIWACAIMPEHTHLVLARHVYHVERMVNLLRGACTKETIKVGNHPLKSNVIPENVRLECGPLMTRKSTSIQRTPFDWPLPTLNGIPRTKGNHHIHGASCRRLLESTPPAGPPTTNARVIV